MRTGQAFLVKLDACSATIRGLLLLLLALSNFNALNAKHGKAFFKEWPRQRRFGSVPAEISIFILTIPALCVPSAAFTKRAFR
jgi:hypothetical protein